MLPPDPKPKDGLSRRDFFQLAALSAATAGVMPNLLFAAPAPGANPDGSPAPARAGQNGGGAGPAVKPGTNAPPRAGQKRLAADVVVIGGGIAGVFAAVTARAKGLTVILVDKGTVGMSGCTPWANTFVVFNAAGGDNRNQWIESVSQRGEYLNNRDFLDAVMTDSQARYDDLVAWGAMKAGIINHGPVLRAKLLASKVQLLERTMTTQVLMKDGRAGGVLGFSVDDDEAVAVTAKAVVMCAGAGAFKSWGYPVSALTSDGDAMAYRVGAGITGKEFNDFHFTNAKYPASCWTNWSHAWGGGITRTSYGRSGPGGAPDLACAFLADAGKAPVSMSALRPSGGGGGPGGGPPGGGPPGGGPPGGGGAKGSRPGGAPPGGRDGGRGDGPGAGGIILGAGTGMSIHKAEGIWPADTRGGTGVPGLFAAGDGLGSMLCGAKYSGIGFSLCGSAVQGARAGESAAAFAAAQAGAPAVTENQLATARAVLFAPRERKSGFTPAWLTLVLQNAMFPYFVLYIKKKERLEAALTTVEFLRDRLAPQVMAKDAHELRLAHETMNMILNAEMKLRAALFRTESRGTHYREDYPARDDANWLAWVKLQRGADGRMVAIKQTIPPAWKPLANLPYEQRYRDRFPGELEFIAKKHA